jgi:hypothetical protein
MASEVSICNLAISMFGLGSLISALDEESTEAEHCNLHYENARDQTLEDHDWGFASVETVLALTGTAPTRWTYSYARPSGCIIEREIVRTSDEPVKFEVALASDLTTQLIYTNEAEASLRYTARVTNPSVFSTGFINALYCRIAMAIAMPLTKDVNKLESATKYYAAFLRQAELQDAGRGHNKVDREAAWISGR